jgi:hypothetical protein
VVPARVANPIARILFPRRNDLSVVKWVISPQIARTKMKITLARRNCSRSTIRRKMSRHAMLSRIQKQVQIPTPMMMMRVMRNPPRRVLSVLPSRRLHLYLTHRIA